MELSTLNEYASIFFPNSSPTLNGLYTPFTSPVPEGTEILYKGGGLASPSLLFRLSFVYVSSKDEG